VASALFRYRDRERVRSDQEHTRLAARCPSVHEGVSPRRIGRSTIVGVVALYALACLAGHVGYRVLLYPAPQHDDVPPPPGAQVRELRAADGVAVHVMEFPNTAASRTIVYFHGNGEVVGDDTWIAKRLVALGFAVTLVEYRGYGRSHGTRPTEAGLYADATAALDDLAVRGVGADRVVLWGASLGTGVAAEMARRGRGAALVLVTPYTSIPDMARRMTPWLPVGTLVGDRFDTLAKAPSLKVPTVIVHGTNDEVVPFAMGERVAGAIAGSRFERVEGGHHMDCFLTDKGLLGRVVASIGK
jgi:pimeloyl-ACP methyl ester carboxylesterase